MSNSGRIGGKKKAAVHTMKRQRQQMDGVDGNITNRATRRAYMAMARKNKSALDEASMLAVKLFNGDVEEAKNWLYEEQEGNSPLEKILMGEGDAVIKQLKDLLEKE